MLRFLYFISLFGSSDILFLLFYYFLFSFHFIQKVLFFLQKPDKNYASSASVQHPILYSKKTTEPFLRMLNDKKGQRASLFTSELTLSFSIVSILNFLRKQLRIFLQSQPNIYLQHSCVHTRYPHLLYFSILRSSQTSSPIVQIHRIQR